MQPPPLQRFVAQTRQKQLDEWRGVLGTFRDYQVSEPRARVQLLGDLFALVSPWLLRGIRSTALRHFLLLPHEMLLARLFAQVVHRDDLPSKPALFLMWVEGTVLRDLADPSDALGVTNGAPGEPPASLQREFHALPYSDRALLYLSLLEDTPQDRVAERAGLSPSSLQQQLDGIWKSLQSEVVE